LKSTKSQANSRILNDPQIKKSLDILNQDLEHPKIEKMKEVVKRELDKNKDVSIIVFSHYRDNINSIYENIKEICNPAILIGQRGEKGLHIPSADIAIFYDSVPSEIRTIQRRGRVGRTKLGKIIFMLTRKTRDETYFYTALNKEKKMKAILKGLQAKGKQTLEDLV